MLPGLALERSWTVTAGLAAVVGVQITLRLPPGATWPGLDHLPEWLVERVQPTGTLEVPDTTYTSHVTSRDIESGVALIHAQALGLGEGVDRLAVLERTVHPRQLNQVTVGALIGTCRESVTKLLRQHYPWSEAPE